jgi:predicted DNA-binding protein
MARKPRSEAASMDVLVIRVTSEERRDLDQVARENGQTRADVIREAVNEYVADYRERGVFGLQRPA